MKRKLANKITIILSVAALFLLLVVSGYVYFSIVDDVKEKAIADNEQIMQRVMSIIAEELESSSTEISTLRSLFLSSITDPSQHNNPFQLNDHYADKYDDLFIGNEGVFYRIKPTIDFVGNSSTIIEKSDSTEAIMFTDSESLHWFNANSALSFHHNSFRLISSDKQLHNFIGVQITKSAFFKRIIRTAGIDASVTPVFIDADSSVLYSTNLSLMSKKLSEIIPENIMQSGSSIISGNNMLSLQPAGNIPIMLLLKHNIGSGLDNAEALAIRIFTFSIVVFILAIIIIRFFTKRISHQLMKMTDTALAVAGGDLSKRIELSSNDEVGLLIGTFNNMVEKLSSSYAALKVKNIELERKITELIEMREELSQQQKLAIVGETMSKITHDIQNKIGGVSIWLQNLELQSEKGSTAAIYIDEMKKALNSFTEMLVNFKRFYRRQSLNLNYFSVITLMEKLINNTKDAAAEKKIAIATNNCDKEIMAYGDSEKILDVLENILLNAVDASPVKGTITIDAVTYDKNASITISDEGAGIAEEMKEEIFLPFYTTKITGSGLGLSIAATIMQSHNGTISCGNNASGGAYFTVSLPLNPFEEVRKDEEV